MDFNTFWYRPCADGVLTVIQELKVKSIIIGKQFEDYENYKELKKVISKQILHNKNS